MKNEDTLLLEELLTFDYYFIHTSPRLFCSLYNIHAIWVDKITDIMVSIKRSIKAKTF